MKKTLYTFGGIIGVILLLVLISFSNSPTGIFLRLFCTPIFFYGKVVDEKGTPIAGATAKMGMCDEKFWTGGTEYVRTTDKDGRFSAWGHGVGINVDVSKNGYYNTLTNSSGNFSYVKECGPLDRHPYPWTPAFFVLRKMGKTVPLIKLHSKIWIQKDGSPISLNLTTGQQASDGQGDIKVEAWTNDRNIEPNSHTPYDWRCRITVINGGLTANTNSEFDFQAPKNGYLPSDEINMPATVEKWDTSASRKYFVKLNGGRFARMDFEMIAEGSHFFVITSYLNPTPGDRNLEFDPAKQINK